MPRVLVPLASGSEELEAVTIIDLLRRAGMEVVVAGLDEGNVIASRGVVLVPEASVAEVEGLNFDCIALPGGMPGAARLKASARLRAMLQRTASAGGVVAALCAAPIVLHEAGLLEGKRVTSYPGSLSASDEGYVYEERDVVVDGRTITSRGPGTAMDFALAIIEELLGYSARRKVELPLMRSSH